MLVEPATPASKFSFKNCGPKLVEEAATGAPNRLKLGGRPSSNSVLAPASKILAAVRVWATKVLVPNVAVLTPASLAAIVVQGVTPTAAPEVKDETMVTIDEVAGNEVFASNFSSQ